jgi:ABC-2 type transport system ATP-binding protein
MHHTVIVKDLTLNYVLVDNPVRALRTAFQRGGRYFRALENINFEVSQGEVFGIIGANGAGKSTLLKVLAGVLSNYEGKVDVQGKISAILEVATSFNIEMTGRENIYRHLMLQGYSKSQIANLEEDIIEFSELQDVIDQKVITYSSGMQARLAFAVITASVNDVLLIDELLVTGDEYFQGKSFRRLKDICSSGRTVIIVSHNLNYVERLCKNALWLEKGRVKTIGRAHDVCMAYYGQYAKEVEKSYPRDFGYIEDLKVECAKGVLKVTIRIIRLKKTSGLHCQIAVRDNNLGVLAALMNTSWQGNKIPAGKGPVDIVAEIQAPDKLHSGLVGAVLVHGSGMIPGSLIQDSWGWDNIKHVYFSYKRNNENGPRLSGYGRIPMKWTKC